MNPFFMRSKPYCDCRNVVQLAVALAFLTALAVFAGGCGYRFSGGGEMPDGIRRIAIEIFDNRTGEAGIESIITNDVINEFTRNPIAEVTGTDDAEAVLTGVIRTARIRSISHRSAYATAEREITIMVDVALTTPAGKIVWSASGIDASADYTVSDEKIITSQNKKSAVADLSVKLAQRIFYAMTDRF